ncbi:hypothetical protein L7F22_055914 [Adiantum nelumboides]|nr:hypothetical protein [Adiantum nelumboides]
MRHEANLWKEKMRPAVPKNEEGGYEGIPHTSKEAKTLIEDNPRWRKKWLSERPRDLTNFHNTPQYLQIDPTYCTVPGQRSWAEFQKWRGKNKALLNYPVLSAQEPPTVNYVVNTLNQAIQLLREVPDLTCQMLVKIARMIVTCIQVFQDTEDDDHPWNLFLEGRRDICWNLRDSPPRWIIMALYSPLMYLPSHFLQTFKEAFVLGFFKISTQIFHPMAKDLKARYVAYANPFRQQQEDIAFATRKQSFRAQVAALEPQWKSKQYTLHQNGVVERKNKHIAEVAQALMAEKDTPHHFWAKAINTDELHTKLDPKAKTFIVMGYSIEQKGYTSYNPSTCELCVSRDVVFDEMAGWYSDVKDNIGADVKEPMDASSGKQESQTLSGPRAPSSSGFIDRPWSGKLHMQVTPKIAPQVSCKGKEKVGKPPCMTSVSSSSSHIDVDCDGSDQSLDEEFGIPAVRTPSVIKQGELQEEVYVEQPLGYEDDNLIILDDKEIAIEHVKGLLKKKFVVFGLIEDIWLSQRQNALDMLSKYGMANCKPISMPLAVNTKLSAQDGDALEDLTIYRRIVGNLIHLTITWPDLSYTKGLQSQLMQLPRKPHLDVVHGILRYVRTTLDPALFYVVDVPMELHGYTNVDRAIVAMIDGLPTGLCFTIGSVAIT